MNKNIGSRAVFISVSVVVLMATGAALVTAQDKKDIPDHGGFETCEDCHAEKHTMWADSIHGKAIRQIVKTNPAATDCGGCHSDKRLEVAQQDAQVDNSQKESFHKISCLACHARQSTENDHRVVIAPAKLCDTCHSQRAIFWGKGAKGIEDSRNFHSGVSCVGCHMTEGNHKMKVLRPDDPSLTEKRLDTCTACHKDNNREARVQQIQEWQSTHDENMAPLLADVKAIEATLQKNPEFLNASLKSKFDDVKANLELLEKDGSRGFHNFVFSLEITGLASADLKEIKNEGEGPR